MTFPLNSKELEREYPGLPEDVELQFRKWKVENPLTKIVRIAGKSLVVRPAIRRTISYLDNSAAKYISPNTTPKPDDHPIHGNRGRPETSPPGLEYLGHPTATPKPGLVEAQNTLLWECVLFPDYDVLRRWPNSIVMTCIAVIYQLSGHGFESFLYEQYAEATKTPQAEALRTILSVFPSIQPADPDLWTQERFLQVLALSHAHLEALQQQQSPRGQNQALPKVPARTMGSRKWSSQGDVQSSTLEHVTPVDMHSKQAFSWEEDLKRQQSVLG